MRSFDPGVQWLFGLAGSEATLRSGVSLRKGGWRGVRRYGATVVSQSALECELLHLSLRWVTGMAKGRLSGCADGPCVVRFGMDMKKDVLPWEYSLRRHRIGPGPRWLNILQDGTQVCQGGVEVLI